MNAICYIDGFNLYHGLRSKGWRKYYWLEECRKLASITDIKHRRPLARASGLTSRLGGVNSIFSRHNYCSS